MVTPPVQFASSTSQVAPPTAASVFLNSHAQAALQSSNALPTFCKRRCSFGRCLRCSRLQPAEFKTADWALF